MTAPPDDGLRSVSPAAVLSEVAAAIPDACRKNVIIIGSLAAGYHYFADRGAIAVRTKDADCLLSPRLAAIPAGRQILESLLSEGWSLRADEPWGVPGDANTPDEELPAVRLQPPGGSEWFVELLTVPETPTQRLKQWVRLETSHGHFGLCSFGFLSLVGYEPTPTDLGVSVARPEMMALANLLEHRELTKDLMAGGFAGRADIKRCNKDLGRVLAIAHLATGKDEDALLGWQPAWRAALSAQFPDDRGALSRSVGDGLRALLASEPDLEQAWHTCRNGLLAYAPPTLDALRADGQRLLVDAVERLEDGAT